MMVTFWSFLLLVQKTASGSRLELTSPAGENPVNISQFGVDITNCTAVIFQLKSCHSAHMWLGDGTGTGSYETAVGIGDRAELTEQRPCTICWQTRLGLFNTEGILDCSSFRTFWLSWGNNRLAFGKGQLPGVNTVFDLPDPHFHEIKVLAFMGYHGNPASFRIGANDQSRFGKVSDNALFSDTPSAEMTSDFLRCAVFCQEHENCGMFSYNSADNACAVFDRMTSSFVVTSKPGWQSWKMLYC